MGKARNILLLLLSAFLALSAVCLAKGWWVLDHSGRSRGEGFVWKGAVYVPGSGVYTEGKTIAKTRDGWKINRVEEDPDHIFLVMRSFLDQWLVVREDYEIPASGEITAVNWKRKQYTDPALLQTVTKILTEAKPDVCYETDHIFRISEDQDTGLLYAAYEGCPIATERLGHLGTVDGLWMYATDIQPVRYDAAGDPAWYTVSCYLIPEEDVSVLERYFR